MRGKRGSAPNTHVKLVIVLTNLEARALAWPEIADDKLCRARTRAMNKIERHAWVSIHGCIMKEIMIGRHGT